MSCSRRDFLRCAGCGAAAAAAAALGGGCAPGVDPAPLVDVPAPANGQLALTVASYPALAGPGGAVRARAPGVDPPLLLVHRPDGGFAALSSICPHRGCPLGAEDFQVVCPCHGSRFDLQGHVTNPPARGDLVAYPTSYDAGTGVLVVSVG